MQIKVDVPWQTALLLDTFKESKEASEILAIPTERVDQVLHEMDEKYSEAILLRYRDRRTSLEIANTMQKAVSTVPQAIRKGMRLLNHPQNKGKLFLGEAALAQKASYKEQESKLIQWEKDLNQRENALASWQNGILERFPTLASVLPVNPALATMKLYELKLSYAAKTVIDGQFENVQELYDYLRNPSAKLRGLNKREMNELRKEVRRAAGQTAPETSSENIADYFPDFAEMKPESWSLTPIVIRYDTDRKPLEIGLYREAKTGEYVIQIFNGDDVVFCHTVDAALLTTN